MGAGGIGDINLNINVNVRGAAGLGSLNAALGNINTTGAKVAKTVSGVTSGLQKQQDQLRTVKGRLDYWEKQYDAIFRASYRLQNVGYGLINVSRKLFSEIKSLTDAWGKFEFTINRAAGALQIWKESATGLNPVYEALIEKVYSLSKELRLFPAEDIAKATYFWGSTTGQQVKTLGDLERVMKSVNPLMKIAALTETSYETAIKGVYSILIQYHRSLADTEDITAKLFLVTQRTALEFPDLINAFKYVGPVAGALGVSFEDVAQTLGAIGDAGIRGTMAGRALRQMFIQTARPTAKARELLDGVFRSTVGLGKGFEELVFPNGKFVGIAGYTNLLATALKNATVRERSFFLASITTANELPVLTALVENQIRVLNGVAGAYDNTKSSVEDSANATTQFKKAWDLLSTSWRGIVGRLREGAEVIKLRIGRQIADALAPTIEKASAFLDVLERWVRRNPEIISALGTFAAGLGAIAAVGGGLFIVAGALMGLYAAIGVIGKAFGPLLGVGLATLGIIATVAEAIVNNWTRIQREVGPAIEKLVMTITGGTKSFEGLRTEWDKLHEAIKFVADFIVKNVVHAFVVLIDMITRVVDSPLRPFIETVGKALLIAFSIRTVSAIFGVGRALQIVLGLLGARAVGTAFALWSLIPGVMGKIAQALLIVKIGAIGTTLAWMRLVIATKLTAFASFVQTILTGGFSVKMLGVAAVGAAGGIRKLALSLSLLGKTSALVVITALVVAIQMLYDADFLGIRTAIEGTAGSLDELTASYKDFLFTVGTGANRLDAEIQSAIESMYGYSAKIAALQADIDKKKAGLNFFSSRQDIEGIKALEDEINRIKILSAEISKAYGQSFIDIADRTEHGLNEVVETFHKYGFMFGDLNTDAGIKSAQKFTEAYFNTIGEDSILSAKEAVGLWNDLIAKGVKPTMGPEIFIRSLVPKEEIAKFAADLDASLQLTEVKKSLQEKSFEAAHAILIGLKAGATSYGDDINAEVNRLLGTMPATFVEIMDEVEELATQAPKDILANLISGFQSLGDVGAKIKAAMKRGPITGKKIVEGLIGDITGSDTVRALNSKYNELNLLGIAAIDSAHASFVQAVTAYESTGKTETLAKAIRKNLGPEKFMQIFTGQFTGKVGKWWKGLTPAQKTGIQEMVDWAATVLGETKPSPTVVTGVTKSLSGKVQIMFDKEFASELGGPKAAVDPIAELIKGMNMSWTGSGGGKSLVDSMSTYITTTLNPDLYSGGYNTLKSWFDGAVAYLTGKGETRITSALTNSFISKMEGHSPPSEGPLRNIDRGGYNIGKTWADGLLMGSQTAVAGVINTASMIKNALAFDAGMGAMSFNTSQDRTINVKVDVASKDGSVNDVDMHVLSEALAPELIRSLEHMASVIT